MQVDRRKREIRNEDGVVAKFGVSPTSIPDYLALVGDSADGFPGIKGWGAKSTAAVLSHYKVLENIPGDSERWAVKVRGAQRLAAELNAGRREALLYKDLATLRDSAKLFDDVDEFRWTGPEPEFQNLSAFLGVPELWGRATRLGQGRQAR